MVFGFQLVILQNQFDHLTETHTRTRTSFSLQCHILFCQLYFLYGADDILMALKAYFLFSYLLLDFPLFDRGTTALCQEVKFGRYDFYEYEFHRYTRIFIFSMLFSMYLSDFYFIRNIGQNRNSQYLFEKRSTSFFN